MVYNVYKNRWSRAFKQKEKGGWIKPHEAYRIKNDGQSVDESWKKLLGIGHWGQKNGKQVATNSLPTIFKSSIQN